ncbi:MAG: hypothetical protein GEU92_08120 [Alphaproteobacteria bacterium]|nr:hypothetical protein [Alphaproteobacteria bacterium]
MTTRLFRLAATGAAPLFCALALGIAAPADAAPLSYRTVALTGHPAPGTAEPFDYLATAGSVNNAGQAAFNGYTATTEGVWSEGGGSLAPVALAGDAAPGTGGAAFEYFDIPVINDSGKVSVGGYLDDGRFGHFTNASGSLAKVAVTGDAAPGTASSFDYIDAAPFNNAGRSVFGAVLASGEEGLWSDRSGSLAKIAVTGDAAAGTASSFEYLIDEYPVINDSGTIAFSAILANGDEGVWRDDGTQAKVAVTGDAAAGTANNFTYVLGPTINNAGQVAFIAGLDDIGGNEGIWIDSAGTQTKVAQTGEAAPGAGDTFDYMGYPLINGAGDVAFDAALAGGGYGIWSTASGGLHKVAEEGDAAAGTDALFDFLTFYGINGNGQVAVSAILDDGSAGVWAEDPFGVLSKIVSSGDLLEVAAGDSRTVEYAYLFGYAGNEEGFPSPFGDNGDLLFFALFDDGSSGVFVAGFEDLVAVPAPAAGLIFAAGVLALGALRRRRA